MSEETLKRFLDRVNSDAGFRELIERDPSAVAEEFKLSPVERLALGLQDEDALRRLAGTDVSGYLGPRQPAGPAGGGQGWLSSLLCDLSMIIYCRTGNPDNCESAPDNDPGCSRY
jgi:hypothetical protein